jgi:hypothetical protein
MVFTPVLCAQYESEMVKYAIDTNIRSDINENMKGIESEPGLMTVKHFKKDTLGGEIAFVSAKLRVNGDTMILFGCPAPTLAFGYTVCIIGDSCKIFYFQMVVSGPNDPGLRCTNKSGQSICLTSQDNDWKKYEKDAEKV